MADPDQLLETLQADVLAVLQNTPSLPVGHLFADNEGDLESRLEKSLGTKISGAEGRRGICIMVMPIEVAAAEKNLPGPPLELRIKISITENILRNRNATRGTLMKSSQAALNVLGALHLRQIGAHCLYGDANPITPVRITDGLSVHIVTLFCAANGVAVTAKPAPVVSALDGDDSLVLTCATSGAEIYYTTDGSYPCPANGTLYAAPIADLEDATFIRFAAYAANLNPGDEASLTYSA